MTNCTREILSFPALNHRKIQAEFSGGDITSDGGALLLRQIDKQLGLMETNNDILHDPREQEQGEFGVMEFGVRVKTIHASLLAPY